MSFFVFLRHKAVGTGYAEQTKVAMQKSRTTALLRALVHIIPVGVAMWEIVLNWNTYFVGYAVYNQAYYQFGAKAHEIAIEASLSAIVFSYVRYELMLGSGIPFGALFSGLQVPQASYLWSMEFWGTVCSRIISLKSKVRLLVVITTSVFLAAIAGPSSAILLVPRLDYWPGGSTNIWINSTSDSLWPSTTNASDVPKQCLDVGISDVEAFSCPAHGWEAVQDYTYTTLNGLDKEYQALAGGMAGPEWILVTGRNSHRRLSMTVGNDEPEGFDPYPVLATIQQTAVADALTETGELWLGAVSNVSTKGHGTVLSRQNSVHAVSHGYHQPYTKVSCGLDYIHGPSDESAIAFPITPGIQASPDVYRAEYNDSILGVYSLLYPNVTKNQLLSTPGSPEDYRLRWVELPQDPFNGSAIGAVIISPRSPTNLTQEILVCNVGAGWGSSHINTSSFAGGTTFTASIVNPSAYEVNDGPNPDQDSQVSQAEELAADTVIEYWEPFFPEKPVIVTEAWAIYLNPFLSSLNTTVINALMSTTPPFEEFSTTVKLLVGKWILAGLVANGLASIGATSTLQGNIKTIKNPDGSTHIDGEYWFAGKGNMFIVNPEESIDWVKLRVDSTIEGYAYNIRGTSPKVAITFLLIYCVIALSHVLYAGISGISSTCWDSIGEVTALAMNSTPTILLKNTCAGILELNIFKIPVRVLAFRDDEAGDGEHLELVFGDVDEKNVRGTPIKPNRVYGTLPKMAKKEKSE
ncbi:hypothetical protein BDR22DRAFT_959977 [Usnea florida]